MAANWNSSTSAVSIAAWLASSSAALADSSAFAAYSRDPERPYTVSAYLEKAGYGSQAAGPVAKCIFLQMSGLTPADPVVLSNSLDTESTVAAPQRQLADTACYDGRFSNTQTTE